VDHGEGERLARPERVCERRALAVRPRAGVTDLIRMTVSAPPPASHRPRILMEPHPWTRPEDRARLGGAVDIVELSGEGDPLTTEELVQALRGCSGLMRLGRRIPGLTREVLVACPELKIVALRSDRFGHGIDLPAADELGIAVTDTDNISSAPPVAEWDLAMILLCLRNAGAVFRQMLAGTETWANAGNEAFVSGELTGRKVGLIGCGHVGQRLIELLAPFRVDLLVCDPYLPEEVANRLGIRRGDLDDTLRHAEILVVQVPLTPRTTRLIGDRELDLLGKGKILINCCRGKVMDQDALVRRLQAGDLIAGLDVFDPEPLPRDHLLRTLPNAFITPHIAWYAPNVLHRYFQNAALEFERFFRGEPLQFPLTRRHTDIRHGRV
jgi:phosphoglycerate dehydrogenase-like enzyme